MPGIGQAAGAAAPANTALPTISGTAQTGSTLTSDTGTWSDSPTSFTYAWNRCDTGGNTCVAITGATSQTYQLQAADLGATVRVAVNGDERGRVGNGHLRTDSRRFRAGRHRPRQHGAPDDLRHRCGRLDAHRLDRHVDRLADGLRLRVEPL